MARQDTDQPATDIAQAPVGLVEDGSGVDIAQAPTATLPEPPLGALDFPETLVMSEDRAGRLRAEVNTEKYVPMTCAFEASQMQTHRDLGARFPVYGQRDTDGTLYVRNQDVFMRDPITGYILDGDSVVGLRTIETARKLEADGRARLAAVKKSVMGDMERNVPSEVPVIGTVDVDQPKGR